MKGGSHAWMGMSEEVCAPSPSPPADRRPRSSRRSRSTTRQTSVSDTDTCGMQSGHLSANVVTIVESWLTSDLTKRDLGKWVVCPVPERTSLKAMYL